MKNIEVYWSHQSPYCYFALDRLLVFRNNSNVELDLRPVLPGVIRDGDVFADRSEMEQHYFLLDVTRTAAFHGLPYAEADPYPVNFSPGTMYRAEPDQARAMQLYYLTAAAIELGQGWAFLNIVSRLIWDGATKNWHEPETMRSALNKGGLDYDALCKLADEKSTEYDNQFASNRQAMLAAGHWGVPMYVYRGEPFYGQDRLDQLIWRVNTDTNDTFKEGMPP